jgi:hypothetical protein
VRLSPRLIRQELVLMVLLGLFVFLAYQLLKLALVVVTLD